MEPEFVSCGDDAFFIKQEEEMFPEEEDFNSENSGGSNVATSDRETPLPYCKTMDEYEEMDYESDISDNSPSETLDITEEVTLNLLPTKSKVKYEKRYELLKTWCESKKIHNITENVLIAYMSEKSETVKPSTLWSWYSMLKTTLKVKDNIETSKFDKLNEFIKQQNVGFKAKKPKIFQKDEVRRFLSEAADGTHLLRKVVLIFGIVGACRRDELCNLTINDVEDKESLLVVHIQKTKTYKHRVFTILNNQDNEVDYLSIIRKYLSLRPSQATTDRLFMTYRNGKYTNQVVGMNKIAKIPKEIAEYLELPEAAMYTGHCFRRTSATLLANVGGRYRKTMDNNEETDYESDISDDTPSETLDITGTKAVTLNLLPTKSKLQYEKRYELFKSWCESKNVRIITENVLIAYMSEKSEEVKPSTLWSRYSMLKTTLRVKENIEISKFDKLIEFIKQQNVGFKAKKTKIFQKDEVRRFLSEAEDGTHLLRKVVLIFGVAGACRRDELCNLTINDVEDKESLLVVHIQKTKTYKRRVFTILNNQDDELDYLGIIRKYLSLRPSQATTDRFFMKYRNGKCTNQVVGINKIAKIPKEIAEYLELPEAAMYTGQCFRRMSATLLANTGGPYRKTMDE